MDIHMPVLDGYAATEMIRKIDKDIPIIAMTADAIAGAREKCESHGMNDYISKPFEPEQFIDTVIKTLGQRKTVRKPENDEILDMEEGIKNIGGDRKIYMMILNEFKKENTDTAVKLAGSIASKDYSEAIQIVHKIKGSSGSIGAKGLYTAARELQQLLKDNDDNMIQKKHELFENLLNKLMIKIDELLNE